MYSWMRLHRCFFSYFQAIIFSFGGGLGVFFFYSFLITCFPSSVLPSVKFLYFILSRTTWLKLTKLGVAGWPNRLNDTSRMEQPLKNTQKVIFFRIYVHWKYDNKFMGWCQQSSTHTFYRSGRNTHKISSFRASFNNHLFGISVNKICTLRYT